MPSRREGLEGSKRGADGGWQGSIVRNPLTVDCFAPSQGVVVVRDMGGGALGTEATLSISKSARPSDPEFMGGRHLGPWPDLGYEPGGSY